MSISDNNQNTGRWQSADKIPHTGSEGGRGGLADHGVGFCFRKMKNK